MRTLSTLNKEFQTLPSKGSGWGFLASSGRVSGCEREYILTYLRREYGIIKATLLLSFSVIHLYCSEEGNTVLEIPNRGFLVCKLGKWKPRGEIKCGKLLRVPPYYVIMNVIKHAVRRNRI